MNMRRWTARVVYWVLQGVGLVLAAMIIGMLVAEVMVLGVAGWSRLHESFSWLPWFALMMGIVIGLVALVLGALRLWEWAGANYDYGYGRDDVLIHSGNHDKRLPPTGPCVCAGPPGRCIYSNGVPACEEVQVARASTNEWKTP